LNVVRNLAVAPIPPDERPVEGAAAETAPLGRRERNRLARHRNYLRAAQAIVAESGVEGLTMQRVADHLDCAVGTIYTYFPSKSALMAELQRTAIEKLTSSYLVIRADTDRLLDADEPSARVRALARLEGIGRFWAATTETFPQEAQLMQGLMTTTEEVMSQDDASRVLPAAIRHLDLARVLLDEAVDAGVIAGADSWARVVTWLAALNGVVQTSRLAVWDEDLFDGVVLAAGLNDDLLRGWGADPAELEAASRHIDELARRGPLAPLIDDPSEDLP
jgi:AcrR family transcriptional regulator